MVFTNSQNEVSSLEYFQSIPWCANHLLAPGAVPFTSATRLLRYDDSITTRDQFFGRTLHTTETIPYSMSFYQSVIVRGGIEDASRLLDHIPQAGTFYALECGLTGFDNIAHGGLLVSLLDEAMGVLLEINQDIEGTQLPSTAATNTAVSPGSNTTASFSKGRNPSLRAALNKKKGVNEDTRPKERLQVSKNPIFEMDLFTAGMEMRFRRPVSIPGVVLTMARIEAIEASRRKMRMKAWIEDEKGQVYVECTASWVGVLRGRL